MILDEFGKPAGESLKLSLDVSGYMEKMTRLMAQQYDAFSRSTQSRLVDERGNYLRTDWAPVGKTINVRVPFKYRKKN